MKRLHYPIPNNLSLLHDELLAAIPVLEPIMGPDGEREAVMQVEGDAGNVWLTVPDGVDEGAIATVVLAHDATKRQPDPRQDRLTRIAELLAVPRSTWTASQRTELLELTAKLIADR